MHRTPGRRDHATTRSSTDSPILISLPTPAFNDTWTIKCLGNESKIAWKVYSYPEDTIGLAICSVKVGKKEDRSMTQTQEKRGSGPQIIKPKRAVLVAEEQVQSKDELEPLEQSNVLGGRTAAICPRSPTLQVRCTADSQA